MCVYFCSLFVTVMLTVCNYIQQQIRQHVAHYSCDAWLQCSDPLCALRARVASLRRGTLGAGGRALVGAEANSRPCVQAGCTGRMLPVVCCLRGRISHNVCISPIFSSVWMCVML